MRSVLSKLVLVALITACVIKSALAAPVCTTLDKCGSEICDRSRHCHWQDNRNCGFNPYCYAYSLGSLAFDELGLGKRGAWPSERIEELNAWAMEAYNFSYSINSGWRSYGLSQLLAVFENFVYGQTFARVTYSFVGRHCNCQLNWEESHIFSKTDVLVVAPNPGGVNPYTIQSLNSYSSPSSTGVTVNACGSAGGWVEYLAFYGGFKVGAYIYQQLEPPPSPPRLSWVEYTSRTSDGFFAIANASFLYRSTSGMVYRVTLSGPSFLRGWWWNATALKGALPAETGINWEYQWGVYRLSVFEPVNMKGYYDFSSVRPWGGFQQIVSRSLTGTYLVMVRLIGSYLSSTTFEVETSPGSGQYTILASDSSELSYTALLSLNNQRLRVTGVNNNPWYYGSFSGFVALFNPSKLDANAQPIGWEVYRDGKLVEYITTPFTRQYSGDGSTWRMVSIHQVTPNYKLTLRVLKPDGQPANGTKVKIDGVEYVANASGVIQVFLQGGRHTILVDTTYYGPNLNVAGHTNWRRYVFWMWSDHSTQNPRNIDLQGDTTLVAYVYDERALLVRWEPWLPHDTTWGVSNASNGARFSYDQVVWLRVGQTVQLLPVEGGGAIFTYWRVGSECFRGQSYRNTPLLTLTIGDKGLSAIAVFRFAATNQTMLPPGATIANPVVYVPGTASGGEEYLGKRGWWQLTVTHAVSGKTSPGEAGFRDDKTWVWALLTHSNGSVVWAPVTGVWRMHMEQDWDPSRHIKNMPGGVRILEWNSNTVTSFPKVVEPPEYRDWRLITLSAWKIAIEEMGQGYDTTGLWLANGSSLALYNVSFAYMGLEGKQVERVFWHPIAVSTFRLRVEVVYNLTGHNMALWRRQIFMFLYINVSWKYEPPLNLQLLGFKVHAPLKGFVVTLEKQGCTGIGCVGYYVSNPSQTRGNWSLYILSLGDTEEFYRKAYPMGLLGGDGYSSVRSFALYIKWAGTVNQPTSRVWGSDRYGFQLAPATAYGLEWSDPNGPYTIKWSCFSQSSAGFTALASYTADLTFDVGQEGRIHSLKDSMTFTGVNSPYTVNLRVSKDDWIAFYPIPAGGRYLVTENALVPVPVFAKYPPRS
ncbi:MAG: hypothetical protein NZ954_00425 [Thermofilaceae archaeon]|nr:hypothetical protein [Thermofilaceae archaeon]MCX8180355.1 hypothetical protein [Thermofilaceae archaeon]MDW8003890.1 hypothetical protein [Thermofilaceae archaeon]